MERTFVMIKPEGVQRSLIGDIIKRIEQVGLRIVAMKMIQPTREFVEKFYPSDNEWFKSVGARAKESFIRQGLDVKKSYGSEDSTEMGKVVKKWLIDTITRGPVVGMVIEGNRAIIIVRKMCGNTYPDIALPGTIRGDFSTESVEEANVQGRAIWNVIHASGNEEEAKNEINLWFRKEDIMSYRDE